MRKKRNDGGYILIVVLLVFAVLSIVGMTVAGVAMSRTNQTSQNLTFLQARKAAEMGLKDYQKLIRDKAQWIRDQEIYPGESNPDVTEQLKDMLNQIPESYDSESNGKLQGLSGNPGYRVERTGTEYNDDDKTVRWEIKSTGTVNGNSRSITENVMISLVNTKYQENSEEITPEYMGITLPYHDGSIMAGDNVELYWKRTYRFLWWVDDYKNYDDHEIKDNVTQQEGAKIYKPEDVMDGKIIFRGDVLQSRNVENEMDSVENQFDEMPAPIHFHNDEISGNVDRNMRLDGLNRTVRENLFLNGNVFHRSGSFTIDRSFTVNGYYFANNAFSIAPSATKHFVFMRTVYIDGDLTIDVNNGSTVEFREGIVCSGDIKLKVGHNSTIIIGHEKNAGEEKSSVSLFFDIPEYK